MPMLTDSLKQRALVADVELGDRLANHGYTLVDTEADRKPLDTCDSKLSQIQIFLFRLTR